MTNISEEVCEECATDVALGLYLNICNRRIKDLDCKKIYQQISDGKITSKEAFQTIRKNAPPEILSELDEIDQARKEYLHGSTNTKKRISKENKNDSGE